MKHIRQVVLLILLLLITIGGLLLLSAVLFIIPETSVQTPWSEPSFLFFVFMIFCSVISTFYKLNYTRTLFSRNTTNVNILDSSDLNEMENSVPGSSWGKNSLHIAYFFFGLCLIASCVYLLDSINYNFRSKFSNSIRWEQLALTSGFFLLGVTVLYDAVLTRPWRKLKSLQE